MTQQFLAWLGVVRAKTLLLVVLSMAGLLAGCGQSSLQSVSPTGPSLSAPSQLEASSAVSHGNGRVGILPSSNSKDDEDSDADSDADSDEDSDGDDAGMRELEIEGVIASATTGCPIGSFTVRVGAKLVTVKTSAQAVFKNGVCSNLQTVGTRVEVKGRQALDGSLSALRIEVKPATQQAEAKIEGAIRTPITACPTGSFAVRVSGSDVLVRTSSLTVFDDGSCRDLRAAGTRVAVKGRRALDGSIDATRIEVKD